MLTGMFFARRCIKASKGKDREDMYDSYKIMSKAVGVKKRRRVRRQEPCGPRKQPRTERMSSTIQLAKIPFLEEIKGIWSCGKSTSKTQLWPWTKPQSA